MAESKFDPTDHFSGTIQVVVFGSPSSTDCDASVVVDSIPSVQQCKRLCHCLDTDVLPKLLKTEKPINSNLMVVEDGVVTQVYKGEATEVNNSIYHTFKHHLSMYSDPESYTCPVTKEVARDVPLAIARAVRCILTFLTRTEQRDEDGKGATTLRPTVKKALNIAKTEPDTPELQFRVATALDIPFHHINFTGKHEPEEKIWKTIAFQVAQKWALLEGLEIYSKEEAWTFHPELRSFLQREKTVDLKVLDEQKNLFLVAVQKAMEAGTIPPDTVEIPRV